MSGERKTGTLAQTVFFSRPLFPFVGFFALGLISGRGLPLSAQVPLGACFILLGVLFLSLLSGKRAWFFAFSFLFAFCLGVCREKAQEMRLRAGRELLAYAGAGKRRLVFRVDSPKQPRRDYTVVYCSAEAVLEGSEWKPLQGRFRLAIGGQVQGLFRGRRFVGLVSLKKPRSFRNPGGFDYEKFLARRGVAVTGWLRSGRELAPLDSRPSFPGLVDRVRERWLEELSRFPGQGAALVRALVAGDRASLPLSLEHAFSDAGLSHLLAISGLHLGLVAFSVFFAGDRVFRRIPWLVSRTPSSRAAAAVTAPAVIVYALMTGFRLPAQRALVMLLVYLAAVFFDRPREIFSALFLAAFLILFKWPEALFELSFQLSFLCVFGILHTYPRVMAIAGGQKGKAGEEMERIERFFQSRWARFVLRVRAYFFSLLVISLAAQWWIFPLQVSAFHVFNPLAPFFNLVAVPWCGLALLPLGLLGAGVYLVWPCGGAAILKAATWTAGILAEGMRFAGELPGLPWLVPGLSWMGFLCWYGSGLLILEALFARRAGSWSRAGFLGRFGVRPGAAVGTQERTRPRGFIIWAMMAVGLLLAAGWGYELFRSRSPFPKDSFVVAMFDVGQAQSLLVRTEEGKYFLVDGGGFYRSDWDVGRGVLMPALVELGVRELEAVILSHPHPDHARGLFYILSHFKVKRFFRGPDSNRLMEELVALCRREGIPVQVLSGESAPFMAGGTLLAVLNPEGPGGENLDDEALNERSLVVKLSGRFGSALLTGDIGKKTEERLVEKFGPQGRVSPGLLRAEVMSAPHHGSRESSSREFLEAVDPRVVLVSAGGGERLGLPAEEVLREYESLGAQVLSTRTHGFCAAVISREGLRIFAPFAGE